MCRADHVETQAVKLLRLGVMPPSTKSLDASDVATFFGSEEGDHFGNFVQGFRSTGGVFCPKRCPRFV
jgi:hypothetical protein